MTSSSGSCPPMLLATSQVTNQMNVMGTTSVDRFDAWPRTLGHGR